MELYEIEHADAVRKISDHGKNVEEFLFDMSYLAPDPDGAGMFTVQYEVTITNRVTSKSLTLLGGIGSKWPDDFEYALQAGYFD